MVEIVITPDADEFGVNADISGVFTVSTGLIGSGTVWAWFVWFDELNTYFGSWYCFITVALVCSAGWVTWEGDEGFTG